MKRANGTGSVIKLSGARRRPYAVKVSGRDSRGRIVQRFLSYHSTAQEAQAALDTYNASRAAGIAVPVDALSFTLGEIYARWSHVTYPQKSAASVYSHKSAWNRLSPFAGKRIRDFSVDDWQRIIDAAAAEGKSASTVNNLIILIHALNSYALQRDYIPKDYSQFVRAPHIGPKSTRGALDDLQLAKIERLARAGFPFADCVLLLCYTGFRISEFLSLTPFSFHAEQGGYLQGGLKTDSGRDRIVPVHPKVRPYLDGWLAKRGQTIICTDTGAPYTRQTFRPLFDSVMAEIGAQGVTPHWCRHTFATRLHAAGVDELTAKWLLGHSTENDITHHYTHATINLLRDGILKLA